MATFLYREFEQAAICDRRIYKVSKMATVQKGLDQSS